MQNSGLKITPLQGEIDPKMEVVSVSILEKANLSLWHKMDSEGRLRTKLHDKRDVLKFPIVNFPFICNNIPAAPSYGVHISQFIRYSRTCGSYNDFIDRGWLQTRTLLKQWSYWLS